MKYFLSLFFTIVVFNISQGQFVTIGDAEPIGGSCIKLTNDLPYSEGIAYSTSRLDLNNYFEIEFDVYLGDKDDFGADGITFVLQNDPRGFEAFGTRGEFLGYGGRNSFGRSAFIAPSVAIEFDTYQNPWQNDPFSDHVAFLQNGINRHFEYFNNENDAWNIEDDRLHSFRFRWDPSNKEITVFFDEYVVYNGKIDLVNEIFEGKTNVIWGFTASTGRKHNLQYFCFRRLAKL